LDQNQNTNAQLKPRDISASEVKSSAKNIILLNKYFNELLPYYRVTYNHKELPELKDNQIRLINYFKNKYHLDYTR
jgi:hypothetical protein